MNEETQTVRWNPLPGQVPEDISEEFSAHCLQRDIEQTNLAFYAFALFAVFNLGIDIASDALENVPLHAFFLVLSLGAASFMRRVLDHRLLRIVVNIASLLVVAALVLAKTQLSPDDWFVYFADIFIIACLTLTIPVHFIAKLVYALLIVGIDVYAIQGSGFTDATAAGVILMLLGITAFSAIIYYRMQRAHFEVFMSLRKEQAMIEALRNAQSKISELQLLLPVGTNCKKVRDDNPD